MRDEAIKISVVVPIYNVEVYLRTCIESITGQSYRNLEIILVDDGSTDRCPEICDDYAKKDKRVQVIHKRNGGVTSARKAGAAAATGDYVLSVDGDDWIEPDRIEALVGEGIMPTHADMVFLSGYVMEFEESGAESVLHSSDVPIGLFEKGEIENSVFPLLPDGDMFGTLWSWAIRRELMLKNQMLIDDRIIYEEDMLCVCFCLLEAKSVMMLRQNGYHYIRRTTSIVRQLFTSPNKDLLQMKIWHQLLKGQLEQKQASEKIYKICGHIAAYFMIVYCDHDLNLFLQRFADFLFPFPCVNNGMRIVVYGAGRIGYALVQRLDKTKKCSVVLWVDRNQSRPTVPGHTIHSRDAIFSADYDYIVVAILDAAAAKEVKHSLILDGIPEDKIALMETGAILKNELICDH